MRDHFKGVKSHAVLFVANLFHRLDSLAVELFLNGDLRQGRGCRGAEHVGLMMTKTFPSMLLLIISPPDCHDGRSSIGHLLQVVGVPTPLHRDL